MLYKIFLNIIPVLEKCPFLFTASWKIRGKRKKNTFFLSVIVLSVVENKRVTPTFLWNINVTVSPKCSEYCKVIDYVSCLAAFYWWRQNVKVAHNPDGKIRIYCPESLEQFYQKPIPLWHFFSPINQRAEIYQWTVVRDRWAEGWEGQQRFFTGPLRHSPQPHSFTFMNWSFTDCSGFNLFHTLRGKMGTFRLCSWGNVSIVKSLLMRTCSLSSVSTNFRWMNLSGSNQFDIINILHLFQTDRKECD